MKKFYDTNALLHNLKEVKTNDYFLLSSKTLEELENIKTSGRKSEDIKFKARKVTRFLKDNEDKYECIVVKKEHYDLLKDLGLEISPDNLIMACADRYELEFNEHILFITNDICCYNMCKNVFKMKVQGNLENVNEEYKGFKEVTLSDEELSDFYKNKTNSFELVDNEYLIIKNNENKIIDKYKYSNGEFLELRFNKVESKLTDKIKPKNLKQQMAFDMMQDNKSKIKVLQGIHGTGKTLLMINHALQLVERGKHDKIVYVIQNQQVENTCDIGALPGDLNDKLQPYINIFADKVGGQFGVDALISDRKLEIIPLAFIRGRSFDHSIVIMSESENTTTSHIKLLLSRLEENSMLMLDGDFRQTDKEVFKTNNGLKTMIKRLKGQPEFALMTLNDVERSRLANLASLLD